MAEVSNEFETPGQCWECMWICVDPGDGSSSRVHAKFVRFLAQQPREEFTLFHLKSKCQFWCGGPGRGYEIHTSNAALMVTLMEEYHCSKVEPTRFFEGIESRADLQAILDEVEDEEIKEAERQAKWAAQQDAYKRKRDVEDIAFVASKDPKLRELRRDRENALKPRKPHAWPCGVFTHRVNWMTATEPTEADLVLPELPAELREFLDSITQRALAQPSHARDALMYPVVWPGAVRLLERGASMLQCAISKYVAEALKEHDARVEVDVTGKEGSDIEVSLVVTVWRK